MEKNQAIEVLEQALNAATLKGVYSLKDIETILIALVTIKKEENE
jgi:hypothetical protein